MLIRIFLLKIILVCAFLVSLAESLYAYAPQETTFKGVVVDKTTGTPLPTVHVYISQSQDGATTDENGEFEFSTNITGDVILVFSFIGYKTVTENLNLTSQRNNYSFEIELEPDSVELGSIEVTDSNSDWQENFSDFKNQFIGSTRFANQTYIENSWVLDINRNERGHLTAKASQPVIVTNHALGFRIHVDLIEFMWDQNNVSLAYTFYSRFEELTPKNNSDRRKWNRNREDVYEGSFRHFLASLYSDRLNRDRFEVVFPGSFNRTQIGEADPVELRRYIISYAMSTEAVNGEWKAFKLSNPLDVLYGRASRVPDQRVRSRLVSLNPDGIFLISESGHLHDPRTLRIDGFWSSERVANLLPSDLIFE